MFQRAKSHTLLVYVLPYFPILSPEKQQRSALLHHHVLDLGNKDGMVTRLFRRMQTALQVRQRPLQHRGPVPGAFKPRPSLFLSMFVSTFCTRVVLRNRPLILAEHVDSESFFRVQMR